MAIWTFLWKYGFDNDLSYFNNFFRRQHNLYPNWLWDWNSNRLSAKPPQYRWVQVAHSPFLCTSRTHVFPEMAVGFEEDTSNKYQRKNSSSLKHSKINNTWNDYPWSFNRLYLYPGAEHTARSGNHFIKQSNSVGICINRSLFIAGAQLN